LPIQLRKTYQLKVTLKGIRPPIWRRILTESTMPLPAFHLTLQVVMGWDNAHLHQFTQDGKIYSIRDPEFNLPGTLDESQYRLHQLLKKEKDHLVYEYDFGDGWEHHVVLEKILPYDPDQPLPLCIKGKRACPPEDVGGVWGYTNFLEALTDPAHPDHDDYRSWVGDSFDPLAFELEEVNALLHDIFRS